MGNNSECPKVTVLMPVYNGGRYLREAITSILAQSFADFELLIIDDGSTDDSVAIIKSFSEPKIRLVLNEQNIGVARTLNKGIDLAKGEFIARMDADDISLPLRLEKQLEFLLNHPEINVVATKVRLIDADGRDSGIWPEDFSTSTCSEIIRCLPHSNCIAHPSVMMRVDEIRQYRYWEKQTPAQDYNLWLRMASANVGISKLDNVLLKHRRHAHSVTTRSNLTSFGIKDIYVKFCFLLSQFIRRKYLNRFDLRVLGSLLLEVGKFGVVWLEKQLRYLVRLSLLSVGHFLSLIVAARPQSQLFFFFPFFHTGGAERVHADIVAAVAEQKPWVVFTHASQEQHFRESFHKNGHCIEVSSLLGNAVTRIICLGYFASQVNRKEAAKVFGANTPFFYELLPYIDDHIECIDLVHAFGGGLEEVSLPCVVRLNSRIVINRKTFNDFKEQYALNGIDGNMLKRIFLIENAVLVPADLRRKERGKYFKVLYVGRGSIEKRVHLIGKIAELCKIRELPIDFTLIGNVADSIDSQHRDYCTIVGPIVEASEMEKHYQEHDLLIVTSIREGFPLVIMEAMAHGVVPVSTNVGGISDHVIDGKTGFLVPVDRPETEIVASFVAVLARLQKNRGQLEAMSQHVYLHAREHFDYDRFNLSYRQLLLGGQGQ